MITELRLCQRLEGEEASREHKDAVPSGVLETEAGRCSRSSRGAERLATLDQAHLTGLDAVNVPAYAQRQMNPEHTVPVRLSLLPEARLRLAVSAFYCNSSTCREN